MTAEYGKENYKELKSPTLYLVPPIPAVPASGEQKQIEVFPAQASPSSTAHQLNP